MIFPGFFLTVLVAAAPTGQAPPSQSTSQATDSKTVLVLETRAVGVDGANTELIAAEIARLVAERSPHSVIGMADVKDLLSLEQDRQSLGCSEDLSCMAEISRKLEADLVIPSTLGRVGKSLVLTLSLVDAVASRSVGRADATLDTLDRATEALPDMLAQLFGWEGAEKRAVFRLPEGQKLSFAVFDLKAAGVPDDIASNLTQILSVELKRIEGSSVVSRDDLVAMLELDEQKAMLGCDDAGCFAELGGALGVDKLVTGNVGKLSDRYVVVLQLIDARRAKVDNRITETFKGEPEQLIGAVRSAARSLLGLEVDGAGQLVVTSNQEQAEVFLDNAAIGRLPLPPVADVTPGRHILRVARSGFFDWQSDLYVESNDTTVVWADLKERPQRWYQRWWVWAAVGGVVAAGASAAVYFTRPEPTTGSGTVSFH